MKLAEKFANRLALEDQKSDLFEHIKLVVDILADEQWPVYRPIVAGAGDETVASIAFTDDSFMLIHIYPKGNRTSVDFIVAEGRLAYVDACKAVLGKECLLDLREEFNKRVEELEKRKTNATIS